MGGPALCSFIIGFANNVCHWPKINVTPGSKITLTSVRKRFEPIAEPVKNFEFTN